MQAAQGEARWLLAVGDPFSLRGPVCDFWDACLALPYARPVLGGRSANTGGGGVGGRCGAAPPPPVSLTDWLTSAYPGGWSPDSRLLLSSDDGDPAVARIKLPEFMFPMAPNS
jgi:hypothetical protein